MNVEEIEKISSEVQIEEEAPLPINKKSWQVLLTDSGIFRNTVYHSLNYPKALLLKTKIKGGLPFIMSLRTEDDAVKMSLFLEHIKCPEVKHEKGKTTVYGTLEPGIDYMTRFDGKCLDFFKPDDSVSREKPPVVLPQDSNVSALVTLFGLLSAQEQDMFLTAIVIKNKKAIVNKDTIMADFAKKLTAKFKEKGYLIMGAEQTTGNAFTFTKSVLQLKHTFVRVAPEDAFKI